MATTDPIRVDGLKEFGQNLKRIDNELPKAVRLAANEAANVIVDDVRPRIPLGPAAGGHARSSVKAKSTRTLGRVQAGSKKYPYFGWLEFGGRVGPNRSVRRPYRREGRYLWVSFARNYDTVHDRLIAELLAVARRGGVEVDE